MKIINVTYDKLEEALAQELEDFETYEVPLDESSEDLAEVYTPFYRVTDKNVIVAEGTWYRKEGENFEPDFSISVVYADVPDEEFDPSKWLYWENDPATVAIHNYLNAE